MSRMLQALKNLDAKGPLREDRPSSAAADDQAQTPEVATANSASTSPILRALQGHSVAPQQKSDRDFAWLESTAATQEPDLAVWHPSAEAPALSAAPSPVPVAAPAAVPLAAPAPVAAPVIVAAESVAPLSHSQPRSSFPAGRDEATALERAARKNLSDVVRAAPYRQLVERLRQDFRSALGNCLMFTGIGPQSAADEMLVHAALAFAEAGDPVLLIDADVARGKLSKALGSDQLPGVAEVVSQQRPWLDLLHETVADNVALLPAGQLGLANPAAAADEIARLLEQAEREFRIVLVDGGCAGDLLSQTLGRLCDATYFVIRLGSTDALEAQDALRRYRSLGARVLGCVATNVQTI